MNQTPEVKQIAGVDNHLGETPIWSVAEQALYWVNCEQPPALHRWDFATGAHEVWPMPRRIGGVVLRESGVVVVLADGIYDFNRPDGSLSLKVRSLLPEHVKLHETQCDRQGRLWVGSYDHHFSPTNRVSNGGSFFRLDGDHLTPVISGINVSNGLAFSPDGTVMYATDSPTRLIEAFDIDAATGNLSNRRPFVQLRDGEGFADGATIDVEGCYWLAAVSASALRRYRPDGTVDRVVSLPFTNPTKPAFGGPNLDLLFVTSTKLKLGPSSEGNGGLYVLKPGVRGVPEPLLKS